MDQGKASFQGENSRFDHLARKCVSPSPGFQNLVNFVVRRRIGLAGYAGEAGVSYHRRADSPNRGPAVTPSASTRICHTPAKKPSEFIRTIARIALLMQFDELLHPNRHKTHYAAPFPITMEATATVLRAQADSRGMIAPQEDLIVPSFVRNRQAGKQSASSQRLMDEVAAGAAKCQTIQSARQHARSGR